MKLFLLLMLFTLSLTAFADIKTGPYCYSGSAQMKDGTKREVFLQLSKSQWPNIFFVEEFSIGEFKMSSSGELVSPDTLQFNSNNDYIPGGEASYNVDIEVTFMDKDAMGSFKYWSYPSSGYGGFGEAEANPTAVLVSEGTLNLTLCKREIVKQ